VQLSPSEQSIGACTHPEIELQVSIVQMLLSSQFGAGPPAQEPELQASAVVHSLPSVQGVPSTFGVAVVHVPVPGLHEPELLH